MTTIDDWGSLNKREIVRRAQELDDRRLAQIQRQIDSINRLIDAQGSPKVHRYEHELMTLNEQLGLADVRLAQVTNAMHKVAQMIRDKMSSGTELSGEFLKRLESVLVTEAGIDPYHVEHGRTSESDQPTDDEDSTGSETRAG